MFAGVSLTYVGKQVMQDDASEQGAYQTIGGLQAIRASVHTSESSMRAYLLSGSDLDRKGYDIAWKVAAKQTGDVSATVPDNTDVSRLIKDLRRSKDRADKTVHEKAAGMATSSLASSVPLDMNLAVDRDLDGLITSMNIAVDHERERRQQDFLFTEILFIATMGLGALSVILAAYGTGRDMINQANEEPAEKPVELDEHTHLMTRQEFETVLPAEMARAKKKGIPLTLLLIELDQLPNIHAARGEKVYGEVLRGMGVVLRESFRTGDTICRFSETEFAVILQKTNLEDSRIPAERVRNAILNQDWPDCYITANLGAAQMDDDEVQDSLIVRAQQAVEYARRTGRNRVSLTYAYANNAA